MPVFLDGRDLSDDQRGRYFIDLFASQIVNNVPFESSSFLGIRNDSSFFLARTTGEKHH